MNDAELAKLRKKASHALAQAAHYIESTETARLIASKNFENLIHEHEQALSSPVPKNPFN
jgi:hypothetical protein